MALSVKLTVFLRAFESSLIGTCVDNLTQFIFPSPLTERPNGPVDRPVHDIAIRLNVKPEQVLLAWGRAKGVVAVT